MEIRNHQTLGETTEVWSDTTTEYTHAVFPWDHQYVIQMVVDAERAGVQWKESHIYVLINRMRENHDRWHVTIQFHYGAGFKKIHAQIADALVERVFSRLTNPADRIFDAEHPQPKQIEWGGSNELYKKMVKRVIPGLRITAHHPMPGASILYEVVR